MSDLIERQAAIDKWKNDFRDYVNALGLPRDDYKGIMEYIDELPSAEPERKKGKWVHGKLIYSDISIATCTTCGKRVPVGNFCIDCGSYNGENGRRNND